MTWTRKALFLSLTMVRLFSLRKHYRDLVHSLVGVPLAINPKWSACSACFDNGTKIRSCVGATENGPGCYGESQAPCSAPSSSAGQTSVSVTTAVTQKSIAVGLGLAFGIVLFGIIGGFVSYKDLDQFITKYRKRQVVNVRWNCANLLAWLQIFVEALQYSAIAFHESVPWSQTAASARPYLLWSLFQFEDPINFANIAIFTFVFAGFAIIGLAARLCSCRPENCCCGLGLLLVVAEGAVRVIPVLWLPVLCVMFRNVNCTYNTAPGVAPFLTESRHTECWSNAHLQYAIPSMVLFAFFMPLALYVVPRQQQKDMPGQDIFFHPVFSLCVMFAQVTLSCAHTFFSTLPYAFVITAICVLLPLSQLHWILMAVLDNFRPCTSQSAMTVRSTLLLNAGLVNICALVALIINDEHSYASLLTLLSVPVVFVSGLFVCRTRYCVGLWMKLEALQPRPVQPEDVKLVHDPERAIRPELRPRSHMHGLGAHDNKRSAANPADVELGDLH